MNAQRPRTPARRWAAALAGACMIGLGVVAIVGGSRPSAEPAVVVEPVARVEAVEVCDTTEYQGCPQRWDYLLTQD